MSREAPTMDELYGVGAQKASDEAEIENEFVGAPEQCEGCLQVIDGAYVYCPVCGTEKK